MKAAYHHGSLREALLAAALKEVGKSGRTDFTLRSLAKGLGVTHAAAYRHFKDREALIGALAAEAFGRFADALQAGLKQGKAFEEHYIGQGRAYVDFALDHPGYYLLMFRAPSPGAGSNAALEKQGERAWMGLIKMVEMGQASGRIRAGDAQELALVIWSAIHGLVSLVLDGRAAPETPVTRDWVYRQVEMQSRVLMQGMAPAAKALQKKAKKAQPQPRAAGLRKMAVTKKR
jgi:AcrR family transcriptional regulator